MYKNQPANGFLPVPTPTLPAAPLQARGVSCSTINGVFNSPQSPRPTVPNMRPTSPSNAYVHAMPSPVLELNPGLTPRLPEHAMRHRPNLTVSTSVATLVYKTEHFFDPEAKPPCLVTSPGPNRAANSTPYPENFETLSARHEWFATQYICSPSMRFAQMPSPQKK